MQHTSESIKTSVESFPLNLTLYLSFRCCLSCGTDGCVRPINLWSLETVEKRGCHTGRLASGPGCSGHGHERLQVAGNGLAFANGSVHVFEELGRVCGVEVRSLRGIDTRVSTDGQEPIEFAVYSELDRLFERNVGRLEANLVEHHEVDIGALQ